MLHPPRLSGKCLLPVMLALMLTVPCGIAGAQFAVPTLDPASVPKYETQLVIPPAMPRTSELVLYPGKYVDYYEIAVRQFQQFILPESMGKRTTVWGYGSVHHPTTFNYPAFTIEATVNKPVRVKWINGLVDAQGRFLPHLLPVDQTLHWANPNGLAPDIEGRNPNPYTGPVPIVTHMHGAHVEDESDGHTEAWFLPNAVNIPKGYFKVGSKYEKFKKEFQTKHGPVWAPGTATFQYRNDQRASTVWYHDHSLGMTRLNVYAGPAGFYLLRGGSSDLPASVLPGPAPKRGDPVGKKYYEIPIAIQDRSFNANGSLFYPNSRQFFDGIASPYIGGMPYGTISPIWNPEFFGNTIVANGKTWPNLNVEPRRYRFRFLNGCNSRTLFIKMVSGDPTDSDVRTGPAALPFWQIGNEGGFLPAPVRQEQLLITLAERADVIVDFSRLSAGTRIYLINRGPDGPFSGDNIPSEDIPLPADEAPAGTTGQVMQFTVVPLASTDTSTPPNLLTLPALTRLGAATKTRKVSLNEVVVIGQDTQGNFIEGPKQALLGTLMPDGMPMPLKWADPPTEKPRLFETEIWEIYNFTVDAHPIHIHEVTFEVLDRTPMGDPIGGPSTLPRAPGEAGFKDTVSALPGYVTRLKVKFDIPGEFVWHCHIVEHEDNEMMRPLEVVN